MVSLLQDPSLGLQGPLWVVWDGGRDTVKGFRFSSLSVARLLLLVLAFSVSEENRLGLVKEEYAGREGGGNWPGKKRTLLVIYRAASYLVQYC